MTLNLRNCMADRIGPEHGLSPADWDALCSRLSEITTRLSEAHRTGQTRWRDLPHSPLADELLAQVTEVADQVRSYFRTSARGERCKHMVVLGIGGSALGNIALQAALRPHTHNLTSCQFRPGPRLYVLDNVDPLLVGDLMLQLERADPGLEHTMVNVISKSGETAETAAQFLIFRDWLRTHLGPDRAGRHIVAITDAAKGTMRGIVDREGYLNLPVPEGVGGRFSVLSPVGLFSAAMCELDIAQLLAGAADMDRQCRRAEVRENPAAQLAGMLIEYAANHGKPNHVLMPYANSLYMLADWYRQLWAESLGKRFDLQRREVFAGATPIKALGTTDQHSQVQLYREGPNDKVIGFIEVGVFARDVTIPAGLGVEALSYLENKTLSSLLNAEKKATEYALVESNRPNYTIHMPEINEFTVGQFLMLWQVATAYAGQLLNIDAYDQPAVETGKVATFGLMGRPGYEEWADKVSRTLAP